MLPISSNHGSEDDLTQDVDYSDFSSLRPEAPEFIASSRHRGSDPGIHTPPRISSRMYAPRSGSDVDPRDRMQSSTSSMTTPTNSAASSPSRFLSYSGQRDSPNAFSFIDSSLSQDVRALNYQAQSPSRALFPPGMPMVASSPRILPSQRKQQYVLDPVDGFVYTVQFKRAYRNFQISPYAPRGLDVGDFVMVEADRGEDLGIIRDKTHITQYEEEKHTAGHRGRGFAAGNNGEVKHILRVATTEERALLVDKMMEEELTLQVAREKALERGLPMTIVDAEYQYDRHKLTFYFESSRRVDFRDLVSDMFALYKVLPGALDYV